jgi:hypothetical protein
MLMHPSVSLCTEFEQEQRLANPGVSHPQLESTVRDSRRANKHHVLVIGVQNNLFFTNGHDEMRMSPGYYVWQGIMYHEGGVRTV